VAKHRSASLNRGKRTLTHDAKEAEMAKDHGPSVKDDKQYEGLRKKGMSKQRAASIANSPDASSKGGKKSGKGSGGSKSQKRAAGREGGKKSGKKSS
jgi:hypothetical protein